MVRVSPVLVREKVERDEVLRILLNLLEEDYEVQSYLEMCNDMVVKRLYYNDHGPTHSRIVAGSALEIFDILSENGVVPTTVRDSGLSLVDAKAIVLAGAYLHDIGNMIHRENHNITGLFIADGILRRILPEIYRGDRKKELKVRQEILHCIFSHDESIQALSVEAGIIKLADGTDMAEGRARVPYRHGKSDIHAISALAIKSVEIVRGRERPLEIWVSMDNEAGIFQVEEVYGKKIITSGLAEFIQINMFRRGKLFKVYKPS